MPKSRKTVIAEAIFAWLTTDTEGSGKHPEFQPPFTFNDDAERLTTSVDGFFDCHQVASAVEKAMKKHERAAKR